MATSKCTRRAKEACGDIAVHLSEMVGGIQQARQDGETMPHGASTNFERRVRKPNGSLGAIRFSEGRGDRHADGLF
jgi:hypothetical protein